MSRWLTRASSLAIVSVASTGVDTASSLAGVQLQPVHDGIANMKQEVAAGDLWRERGAVILAVRRPG